MYPHERSLVARMANRPFALIGVNSDKEKQRVFDAMKREGITWRSFWNGGGTSGPISKQYGVRSWPTIYVLDHNGVIRAKNVRGDAMDKVVDQLVAEAEAEGLSGGTEPVSAPAAAPDQSDPSANSGRPNPPAKSDFEPSGDVGFEIGDTAPDIDGADLSDVGFKLSDYRGKVVVLDFWGDW